MSTTTPFAVIVDNTGFQTKGVHCRLVETSAKCPRRKRNSEGRDPRTREQRRAMPTASDVLQSNTWKYNTWRRTEHSASSQEATATGQQVCPGRIKRDHQHRPEGKLFQSEAENFRDEDKADQPKIETARPGKSETSERDPCVLFYDELSRGDNKRIE